MTPSERHLRRSPGLGGVRETEYWTLPGGYRARAPRLEGLMSRCYRGCASLDLDGRETEVVCAVHVGWDSEEHEPRGWIESVISVADEDTGAAVAGGVERLQRMLDAGDDDGLTAALLRSAYAAYDADPAPVRCVRGCRCDDCCEQIAALEDR